MLSSPGFFFKEANLFCLMVWDPFMEKKKAYAFIENNFPVNSFIDLFIHLSIPLIEY